MDQNPINSLSSKLTISIAVGFLLFYSLWLTIFIGFRLDHFNFILFLTVAYFSSRVTRKFVLGFVFFWMFWILYDAMRIFPNYMISSVHIVEPYLLEKTLFGISSGGELLTPNEWLAERTNTISDFLSGLFYLTWVPLPMLYCLYLFNTDRRMLLRFSATFLFTNIVGFCIYYAYPAAPPWYVSYYGFVEDFSVPGNAANLLRFDDVIGFPLFSSMYNKNANVFAAIPSLHAAYPVVLLYFANKQKKMWLTILCVVDVVGIWYAAVYSLHHYIIDVLLGLFCAIIAIFVFNLLMKRMKISHLIDKYAELIA